MKTLTTLLATAVLPAALMTYSSSEQSQIDYDGFQDLTKKLRNVRAQRRVPIEVFLKMANAKDTIILDTRSKAAFEDIHLAGAIHLNFSDFTAEKLTKVIPHKSTRIYAMQAVFAGPRPIRLAAPAAMLLHRGRFSEPEEDPEVRGVAQSRSRSS